MSNLGLQVARDFGLKLPAFANQAEAEAHFFRVHNERLQRLANLSLSSTVFVADFCPDSLKKLEHWYFELYNTNTFTQLAVSREEFESCMASYFGEIAVRNCPGATWEIREFAFARGKYEVGVKRGLLHWMCSRFSDHYKLPNNQKRQRIFRMYKQYFTI